MRTHLLIGVAVAAIMLPGAAYAQSAGSTDFEGDIVITSSRAQGVGGVQVPDSSKAKGVLTKEFIQRQTPGNSILDTINSLPGVSFQNNDPFGSAGGTLTIRGFDSSRIGLTFDGVPLNDTGNYALYSNQQLDPELIEQVNVSYGSTDVDSPTAAASGSTVNYTTIVPTDNFGARLEGSIGDYNFFRVFGLLNTGTFTSFGTKAWISASHAENDVVFNNFGKIRKGQFNARVYQPIGSNGDFISIAGNYNVNRNNFFGSAPLRVDTNVYTQTGTGTGPAAGTVNNPIFNTGALRTAGTGSLNRFPYGRDELPYLIARCQVTQGVNGTAQSPGTISAPGFSNNNTACGSSFDERYNPSNTGNIRISSRFTLAPGLVLTVEPSFQYVKANGGGTVTGREATSGYTQTATATRGAITTPLFGFVGGNYYFGRDLNGDADLLDQVTLLAPSQTVTHRYGLISSLRYDLDEHNTLRIAYSHDYGRHRQTGEVNQLLPNGYPTDVFPINNPLRDANGFILEKRDRLSFAILDQVAGEYRGEFGGLTVSVGVRAPFFVRKLDNFCFTTSSSGFVDCFGRGNTAANNTYATANPYSFNATTNFVTGYAPPQERTYRYNRVLPNVGFTYKFGGGMTAYINYSKGLQVPGTDNLYNAFYYPVGSAQAKPVPETSDNFDAGIRYTTSKVQAFVGPWYTRFTNRLASAFDPDTQTTFYRNLGRVDKYGIDGSISYRPIPEITAYVYGSYLKSEIKNNIVLGNCTVATTSNCSSVGQPIYALTAGKRESGAPVYTLGGRLQGNFGPVELGVQAKLTGPRYVNDQNLPNLQCTAAVVNQICPTAANTTATTFTGNTPTGGYTGTRGFEYQVYPAKTPAYTTVDLDARVSLEFLGLNKTTYFQFNVQNVFNKFYVGGFVGGATSAYSVPFVQIGSPRAFIGTVNVQF
ncbi:TonB-dependent receptor [Sphingomonas sp.]|jgi:iron complex outermembrane receptor protein|uniref:TonB-dependent receptor n=1 Tax=Sphingomonas sp. TaxID=28214 RepID=UPI002E378AF9|nr:TonB-dependent receptor [Sphingomonas sp.]HEX4695471.1 TonB-dependent receptor [Sphingomonas sp.]